MLKYLEKPAWQSTIDNQQLSIIHRHSAFTLIEVVIAISLATVIILGTATIFKQASSAFSQSDARSEVFQNTRAIIDIINRDISGATLNANHELFNGKPNAITFLSSTSNNNGQPIALIKYFLNDNTIIKSENTDTGLLNASISDVDASTTTGVLSYNASILQFNYFDQGAVVKWTNRWDSTKKKYLPDAVEVKLTISDVLNRYTETSTSIISIP